MKCLSDELALSGFHLQHLANGYILDVIMFRQLLMCSSNLATAYSRSDVVDQSGASFVPIQLPCESSLLPHLLGSSEPLRRLASVIKSCNRICSNLVAMLSFDTTP